MVSSIFIYLLLLISLLSVNPAVSDCTKPTMGNISATGCSQGSITNFNFSCLAAGGTQGMYRSATVLLYIGSVMYEVVMQCTAGVWSNHSCTSVSANSVTDVTREDCLVCRHSNSSNSGTSCEECPSMCRGSGRCINDTTCCPFYDEQGSCNNSCSTGVSTTDYKCYKPNNETVSKGGIPVATFAVILVILLLLVVVLTIIIIVFLGKMRAHRKIAKYIIEGRFKSIKSCIPRSNRGQQQNGEVDTRRTSRPYVACTTLKESEIELTEEEEKGPPLPPRSKPDAEVGYQKIVTTTKRSVHLYNPVNRSTSLPRQPSSDDGYVDLRIRSQTLTQGEYVELDYQRSRKGRKGKGDMIKTQSAAAITRKRIRGQKGARIDDDDGEEYDYSYPKMSPRLKRKIEKMQQKAKPTPQPKPMPKPKKSKKMVKAPSEDQDGYVATSEIQELKAKARLQKEATLDQDGYVTTGVVHEMKEEEVREKPKLHRGVVDQEGYVDCIILEEPKASATGGPAKKKKDDKRADERVGPSQSSLRKFWQKQGFGLKK